MQISVLVVTIESITYKNECIYLLYRPVLWLTDRTTEMLFCTAVIEN